MTDRTRYAEVAGAKRTEVLERYLPDNYRVVGEPEPYVETWLIAGEDVAGWTLDAYVIPRLRSGNMGAREMFEWFEDDGDGESGPHITTWFEDEPQTPEAMERRRSEIEEGSR